VVGEWLSWLSGIVWGPPLLLLLFGTHCYLTVRLRLVQRFLPQAIRLSLRRTPEGDGDVSQFAALTTALAATIGTGNIVGVATAIAAGGPGAVLWMWLTGVFGIATRYAESLLAVHYRVTAPDGTMAGGAMYVLERGLGMRWLGQVFAAFTAVAAFGIGNMVQANSIAELAANTAAVPHWLTGGALTLGTAVVILGGIQSIARVCERLVPLMAGVYVLGCLVILGFNAAAIPESIELIVSSAFSGHAALGGFIGAGTREAIRYGIARGLFSNESGLGSGPIVAAAAQTRTPVRQALVSATGTFWDTVVVCAMTGVVIVSSGAWTDGGKGAEITARAFAMIPLVGPTVLTFGLLTFVFSTILGWAYYGEKAVQYLIGTEAIRPYRWLWVAAVFVGATVPLPIVWDFADIANGLMAMPNLFALLMLRQVVVDETRTALWEPGAAAKTLD